MLTLSERFARLGTDHAPGQEVRQRSARDGESGGKTGGDEVRNTFRGSDLSGVPVDFSHGDVNETAFAPTPGALDEFIAGVSRGGSQAYTEYRGALELRELLAERLARFTGSPVGAEGEVIITPGTQGALFLALGALVNPGDKVAIVRPDYFANRKLVEFLNGQVVPVHMDYLGHSDRAGIDLGELEDAFRSGAKVFLFSNPNNPAGVIYSASETVRIAELANKYGVSVVADQLYSRLLYSGSSYTHLRASGIDPSLVVTIMGPSKTESLSGYRLGVAFGASAVMDRMEKLQAIVSLRAPAYSQAVLRTWFAEPEGWMRERIVLHQALRDELLAVFRGVDDLVVRTPEAGSYLFPRLPELDIPLHTFVRALREQAAVTVTPGTEFSPEHGHSIRLNFSQNHEAAIAAVERIAELIDRYRKED